MYDRWVKSANAGQVSGVVLLDLSAAFDLVDHDLLDKKLEVFGIWTSTPENGSEVTSQEDSKLSGLTTAIQSF